ncbi:MAG: hypothetical protein WCJ11_02795 [Methylococcaceae bacterium]
MKKLSKNKIIIAAAISALTAIVAFQQVSIADSKSDEAKSVGWYTANIKAAQAKNNECRGESGNAELQATPDCVHALDALQISFK